MTLALRPVQFSDERLGIVLCAEFSRLSQITPLGRFMFYIFIERAHWMETAHAAAVKYQLRHLHPRGSFKNPQSICKMRGERERTSWFLHGLHVTCSVSHMISSSPPSLSI